MILEKIENFKNKIAISSNLKQLTYKQLILSVKNLIKLIKKDKIQSKDLIAVEIKDSHFFIISALACIEGGYSFLLINHNMTIIEKNKILKFCKPKLIIKINKNVEKNLNSFNRQALHAKFLGFVHPRTGKEMYFEAERPLDFDKMIKSLVKASI